MGLVQSHSQSARRASSEGGRLNLSATGKEPTASSHQQSKYMHNLQKGRRHNYYQNDDESDFLSWWKKLMVILTKKNRESWKLQSGKKERRLSFQTASTLPGTESSESAPPFIVIPHENHHENGMDASPAEFQSNSDADQYWEENDTYIRSQQSSKNVSRASTPLAGRPNVSEDRQPIQENEYQEMKRSRSPALPCVKPDKKKKSLYAYASNDVSDFEEEEISIAQAEIMYARATWRMYERITTFREATAMAQQQKTQRFSMPVPNPVCDGGLIPPLDNNNQLQNTQIREGHYYHLNADGLPQDTNNDELDAQLMSNFSLDRHNICFEMDHD